MLKVSIPTPCREDWEAMAPNEQGRHCTSCVKTVIDFTSMNDDEVKNFFLDKKEEKVCGRFKSAQLNRILIELPNNIFYLPMPGWKKFLVASLVVFSTTLFSCETSIKGEPDITYYETTGIIIIPENKHRNNDDTIGKSIIPPPSSVSIGAPAIIVDSVITQGDIEIVPTILQDDLKGQVLLDDTLVTNKIDVLSTESVYAKLYKSDSAKQKNLPKADSIYCDKQVFY